MIMLMNCTNIRIYELLKTILDHFPLTLKRISTKHVKKQECYFQRTLIIVKLTP